MIPTQQEVREARKILCQVPREPRHGGLINGEWKTTLYGTEYNAYNKVLISLAEAYEKCDGWPEWKMGENPYSASLFTPMSDKDFKRVNEVMKKELGYPIDRLSGNIGRRLFDIINKQFKLALLKKVEGLEHRINMFVKNLPTKSVFGISEQEKLAQAITKHIMGEDK